MIREKGAKIWTLRRSVTFWQRQRLRQALAAMEKELGTQLFINRRNKLSLTAAGEYLKQSGTAAVASFDAMLAGMERFAKKEAALKVAVSVSLFPFMLPEAEALLKRFRSRYPALSLEVGYMENDEALEAAANGEADCTVAVWMPWPVPGLAKEVLVSYQTLLSYGFQYKAWQGKALTVEDLARNAGAKGSVWTLKSCPAPSTPSTGWRTTMPSALTWIKAISPI